MMEKKRNVPIWLTVIMLILCVGCLVWVGFDLTKTVTQGDGDGLSGIFYIIAILSAAVYCFFGYDKNASVYYKLTAGCFGVGIFLGVLPSFNSDLTPILWALGINRLAVAVILALLCMLKDLGRKKTMAMNTAVGVLSVLFAVLYAVANHAFTGIAAANLLLTGVLFLMIVAKYKDKEARGRTVN